MKKFIVSVLKEQSTESTSNTTQGMSEKKLRKSVLKLYEGTEEKSEQKILFKTILDKLEGKGKVKVVDAVVTLVSKIKTEEEGVINNKVIDIAVAAATHDNNANDNNNKINEKKDKKGKKRKIKKDLLITENESNNANINENEGKKKKKLKTAVADDVEVAPLPQTLPKALPSSTSSSSGDGSVKKEYPPIEVRRSDCSDISKIAILVE